MSLDVYLTRKRAELTEAAKAEALLRQHGFAEFAEELASRHDTSDHDTLYDANITHNLNAMAEAAGIYKHLWRPDEIGITKASQLIEPLRVGLAALESDPEKFKALNPPNGWGNYRGLVGFVRNYLFACEQDPDADVSVSR